MVLVPRPSLEDLGFRALTRPALAQTGAVRASSRLVEAVVVFGAAVMAIAAGVGLRALDDARHLSYLRVKLPEEAISRLSRSVGSEEPELLGTGQGGTAYRIGDRVVKITSDAKEARAVQSILGRSNKHVVKFYDVFGVKTPRGNVYAIVQEYVEPLSVEEARVFSEASGPYGMRVGPIILPGARGDWKKFEERALEDAKHSAEFDDNDPEVYREIVQRSLDTLRERFKMDEIIKELDSLQVRHTDYKPTNMGKRGDDFVVFDLSDADSKGQEPELVGEAVPR